ncbi:MAG: hypothetical protein ACOVOX_16470, partial [Burkholderiaceae bacterium]
STTFEDQSKFLSTVRCVCLLAGGEFYITNSYSARKTTKNINSAFDQLQKQQHSRPTKQCLQLDNLPHKLKLATPHHTTQTHTARLTGAVSCRPKHSKWP